MDLHLKHITDIKDSRIQITGSKSETNRLLILQALYPSIHIDNISNSDDSKVMQKALQSDEVEIDIHHAGTAMRFLTAYFAVKKSRETIMTGSKRMKERPIKILVEALNQIGCDITYENEEGYPPIRINGRQSKVGIVSMKANVSSQFISALMLIAPSLENGLEIKLEGKVTSVPYIEMTLSLLQEVGLKGSFNANTITIQPCDSLAKTNVVVESDWSSASYFYSIVAMSENATITLGSYKQKSYQGDSSLASIYENLGVKTTFGENTITLSKTKLISEESLNTLDLSNSPDIAQTIAVSCFGLGLGCHLTGLHTLKIKETDRLEALKSELTKLGAVVHITNDSLVLEPSSTILSDQKILTFNDHRMAMAFAPLALRTSLLIEDANVVTKSYPDFWTDLEKLGFERA